MRQRAHKPQTGALVLDETDAQEHSTSYRQDRAGEGWHIVSPNEYGMTGRALCGAPRQGTRLSEAHAEAPPSRERMCPRCLERFDGTSGKESSDVLVSTAV
jgi:hypothetical protein